MDTKCGSEALGPGRAQSARISDPFVLETKAEAQCELMASIFQLTLATPGRHGL